MDERNREFLGRGWRFPVKVDAATGRMQTSEFESDISESVRIILATRKGERMMRSDFGCDIIQYAFRSMDYTTVNLMQECVKDALTQWEPRIANIEVSVDPAASERGLLMISVSYVVRATNNPFNLVYPYYLEEGAV